MKINQITKLAFSILTCVILLTTQKTLAESVKPRQYGREKRFLTWTYRENTVFHFTGYYLTPTYIEFEEGEILSTFSLPKGSAWEYDERDNKLFLKPIEENADTTAILITNKRTYFFELHAKEPNGPFDPNIAFYIKFRYPEYGGGKDAVSKPRYIEYNNQMEVADIIKAANKNFNYSVSGDSEIKPILVFDDGKFTYMKFRNIQPGIWSVNDSGTESLVNYRNSQDYVVIEETSPIFSLRSGALTVCVFNENLLMERSLTSNGKKNKRNKKNK